MKNHPKVALTTFPVSSLIAIRASSPSRPTRARSSWTQGIPSRGLPAHRRRIGARRHG